jgi:hypothetical protein
MRAPNFLKIFKDFLGTKLFLLEHWHSNLSTLFQILMGLSSLCILIAEQGKENAQKVANRTLAFSSSLNYRPYVSAAPARGEVVSQFLNLGYKSLS